MISRRHFVGILWAGLLVISNIAEGARTRRLVRLRFISLMWKEERPLSWSHPSVSRC